MKSKKIIALAIASTLMFQSSFASISVNAAEVEKNTETTEYVYAHRTIVPQYTIKGSNPANYKNSTSVTSADAKFGYSDFKTQSTHKVESDTILKQWAKDSSGEKNNICKRWKCFERTVKLGVMEFRDVKNFSNTSTTSKYEDNVNFCKERYADATLNCEILFMQSYDKEEFDGIYILYPTEDYVILNNLKGYAKNAKQDCSEFTDEEWKLMSTMGEY